MGPEGMINKALIPIAGLGTRMGPICSAVPKAMLPLADRQGRLRPVVHIIIAEALAAGIAQVGLVVSPDQLGTLKRYFHAARQAGQTGLPERIEYIVQPTPAGFGDAVARGADFIGPDEPAFMLLLGDHVYLAAAGREPCAAQVAEAFDARGAAAMVGMQTVGLEELQRVGAAGGEPIGPGLYRCTDFIEKPDPAIARKRLRTPGLGTDEFLAHCGIYIFTAEIFECLAELDAAGRPAGEELQLADAQAMLLERRHKNYYLFRIAGRAYDTGTPAGYAAAQAAMAGESANH